MLLYFGGEKRKAGVGFMVNQRALRIVLSDLILQTELIIVPGDLNTHIGSDWLGVDHLKIRLWSHQQQGTVPTIFRRRKTRKGRTPWSWTMYLSMLDFGHRCKTSTPCKLPTVALTTRLMPNSAVDLG